MNQLAIIGAGQLGSRHLQALALIDRDVNIQVVDPNPEALEVAKIRFQEINGFGHVKKIEYLANICELRGELDLAVVVTNADVRRTVVEELLSAFQVRYLILEKLLFQRLQDYSSIGDLLNEKKATAFVNCVRRMWPFYRELKDLMRESPILEFHVGGSDWGLAGNSIHMLDLACFLSDKAEYTVENDMIDEEIVESKRKGFIELTGSLKGRLSGGPVFSISSYKQGNLPFFISIASEKFIYFIRESEGKAWIATKDNQWAWKEIYFKTPYQSQLTHLAVRQILDTGSCDLVTFLESSKIHIPLLKCLLSFLQNKKEGDPERCPIT